jgi:opacity protein-like surface antigen
MRNILLAIMLVVCLAAVAAAQNSNKYEVFGGFSLSSYDTGFGGAVVGGNDRESSPGFEASGTGYFTNHLGIEGDFDGHFKSKTFTFPSTLVADEKLKSFNFLGGPHYRFSPRGKLTFFTRALIGANHSSITNGSFTTTGGLLVPGTGGSDTDFAMKLGGGVDVGWTRRAAVRLGFDYNPIFQKSDDSLNPDFGKGRTRNDVLFSVGVVFK